MNSTADKVLNVLRSHKLKEQRNGSGEYRCNSPLRGGSDSHSFTLKITDGEHGTWHDFVSGESGSLYDLAAKLGIDLPQRGEAIDTKRPYTGLKDYAEAHGVDASVFRDAKWVEGEHVGRPCLKYPTLGGTRYRFTDGNNPAYINDKGYSACWYGLTRAIEMAKRDNTPLILCNGEASTIVAQHHGLPACATTGGESQLSAALLKELTDTWQGMVWIAMDCDATGERVAKQIHAQLPKAVVIDLNLTDKGDLADFCRLHGDKAMATLSAIAGEVAVDNPSDSVSSNNVMDMILHSLDLDSATMGAPVKFPFPSFHEHGGLANVMMPGKVVGIIAPSGSGKTSFMETFADLLNKRGHSGFWYGPEWTPHEYGMRRIVRYGGPSWTNQVLWELYKVEAAEGIPEGDRDGRCLTQDEMVMMTKLATRIKRWRGRMHYFKSKISITLEDTLAEMTYELDQKRKVGERVTFVVFDYIQVLRTSRKDNHVNRYELALETIKNWTEVNNIVSVVASQVTKTGSKSLRKDNAKLDSDDALYLRDDRVNLGISLNIETKEDPYDAEKRIPTGWAKAVLTKNSVGAGKQEVLMQPRLDLLTWVDPQLAGSMGVEG